MTQRHLSINRRDALVIAGATAAALQTNRVQAFHGLEEDAIVIGRNQDFNQGWRFLRSESQNFEVPGLDDERWRLVDLPHDFSIEDAPGEPSSEKIGPFDKASLGGTATGFTIGGDGWYRKTFRLPVLPPHARVEIAFDGVSVTCDAWLNGHLLGTHLHAYTPFAYDLTPFLNWTGDNVIAVRARNVGQNSRWYAGSGIYRDVRLNVTSSATRISRWGVGAWTRRIADGRAQIDVLTKLEGSLAGHTLITRLRDRNGEVAAEASCAADRDVSQTLTAANVKLWSPDSPSLYSLESELRNGDATVDVVKQPFGVRIVEVDAANGLRINGLPVKLRGGCIHHDNGLLGACAFSDADERRVLLLKSRGFNAIRSSHNPSSASLREACDRLGMLLIEEAFDMWHAPKLKDDYAQHFPQDWKNALAAMVLSARNSPSVLMWSIGNEIPDRSKPEGVEWSWKLANLVRQLDPTRPVTAALNGTLGPTIMPSDSSARPGFSGKADEASVVFIDVAGYNYRLADIEDDHLKRPERIIYASETFPRDVVDYARLAEKDPYFLGEFVWTAIDYIGEAGLAAAVHLPQNDPTSWFAPSFPWVNAWCGDIDLIGNQKPQSLVRDVAWGLSPVEILVQKPIPDGKKEWVTPWGWSDEMPIWTWPAAPGETMAVRVYTSGDCVELRLNGQLVGTRKLASTDKMCVELPVPYTPGNLEAVAYRDGVEIGRKVLETVGAAAKLFLIAENKFSRRRDGLAYVRIEILDAAGRVVPEAEQQVRLDVSGGAELIAFGSANPLATGSIRSTSAQTFRGRALAILRAKHSAGRIFVRASSEGLAGSFIELEIT